jgi:hypothetical protein
MTAELKARLNTYADVWAVRARRRRLLRACIQSNTHKPSI